MGRLGLLVVLVSGSGLVGCGGGGADCPPDFPVERDGFCYRADGGEPADGSTGSMDGATTDGGAMIDGSVVGDDGSMTGDGGDVICVGTHPLLDGGARFCTAGDCYCGTPENCFPSAIADTCCPVAVVCADTEGGVVTPPPTDGGGGVICVGTHPLLDGGARFCGAGDCFCGDPDNCFPSEIASTCCLVAPVCGG